MESFSPFSPSRFFEECALRLQSDTESRRISQGLVNSIHAVTDERHLLRCAPQRLVAICGGIAIVSTAAPVQG